MEIYRCDRGDAGMEAEKVIAMAVAAIAEEIGIDAKSVIIHSFNEIQKSSLEKYIDEHHLAYHKYQLGEIQE